MTNNPTAAGATPPAESNVQKFERILSTKNYKPFKAILESLQRDMGALSDAVEIATSYSELVSRLGYKVILTKQLHEQDCYTRLGPAGGIRVVHPYHDVDTYSTLVTLVNFDSTVTTTPQSVDFFSARFVELKAQLKN